MKFCRLLGFLSVLLPMALWASVTIPSGAVTDPLNLEPAVRQAYQQFYILDYDGALAQFQKIEADHPDNPLAADYVLETVLFRELWRLDLLDTTFYAHDGFLTGKHAAPVEDAKTKSRILDLADKAIALADDRLKEDPQDADALYARAWARSLSAVYTALVERSFVSALHLALQARSDDDKVLQLRPGYVDAKLIVGIHQYVVGSLPIAFKVLAGVVGIHGSKAKGLQALREAGARGVITSVEARTALSLFLRREARYGDAIAVMQSLQKEYPRNFLFCLEVANLTKDEGQGGRAIAEYHALLGQAAKASYFPSSHLELAWYGLADALRGQKDYQQAVAAYAEAAGQPTANAEIRARSTLSTGEIFDLLNQRQKAEAQYRKVLESDVDSAQADVARKYLKTAFTGN